MTENSVPKDLAPKMDESHLEPTPVPEREGQRQGKHARKISEILMGGLKDEDRPAQPAPNPPPTSPNPGSPDNSILLSPKRRETMSKFQLLEAGELDGVSNQAFLELHQDDVAVSDDEDFFKDPDLVTFDEKEAKRWNILIIVGAVGWILFIAFYIPFIVYLAKPTGLNANSWNYNGYNANPSFWYLLGDSFQACQPNGPSGSPIGFTNDDVVKAADASQINVLEKIAFHKTGTFSYSFEHGTPIYTCSHAESCGYIQWLGEKYYLTEMRFHALAQHEIFGSYYPMELEMIHEAEQNDGSIEYAVLNVPYAEYPLVNNTALNPLWWGVLTNPGTTISNVQINALYPLLTGYYVYSGSLSFPPCTPNVLTFITERQSTVSIDQVSYLKNNVLSYPGNSRPIQPLNGREVLLYSTTTESWS